MKINLRLGLYLVCILWCRGSFCDTQILQTVLWNGDWWLDCSSLV